MPLERRSMSKRALIFLNGNITSIDFIHDMILKGDHIVSVDGGIRYIKALSIKPDVIIGDFDSSNQAEIKRYSKAKILSFNQEKNATDGDIAIEYVIENHFDEVMIFGALGNRVDHMLSNISKLEKLFKHNIKAEIVDEFNRIAYTENQMKIRPEGYKYFSVLPVSEKLVGINIIGGKYPLENAKMLRINSLGLSNEFLENEVDISFTQGAALIIRSKDQKGI